MLVERSSGREAALLVWTRLRAPKIVLYTHTSVLLERQIVHRAREDLIKLLNISAVRALSKRFLLFHRLLGHGI